jgi:hypothetical protein
LDKTENRKEEVIKDPTKPDDLLQFHVNPIRRKYVNELFKSLDSLRKTQGIYLSKKDTSPFRSEEESQFISSLSDMLYEATKYALGATFAVEYLEQRLENVEKILDEIAMTLKTDLPNVKDEITNLQATIKSEDFMIVSNFVQDMDKTLSKLDKNRKDILRDSVV